MSQAKCTVLQPVKVSTPQCSWWSVLVVRVEVPTTCDVASAMCQPPVTCHHLATALLSQVDLRQHKCWLLAKLHQPFCGAHRRHLSLATLHQCVCMTQRCWCVSCGTRSPTVWLQPLQSAAQPLSTAALASLVASVGQLQDQAVAVRSHRCDRHPSGRRCRPSTHLESVNGWHFAEPFQCLEAAKETCQVVTLSPILAKHFMQSQGSLISPCRSGSLRAVQCQHCPVSSLCPLTGL